MAEKYEYKKLKVAKRPPEGGQNGPKMGSPISNAFSYIYIILFIYITLLS